VSFEAVVLVILAVVIVAFITLGLWNRRRPQDIWNRDRLRAWARRSEIERQDVEEILEEHPEGFKRPNGSPSSHDEAR
jgi:FtsZ-interacting cell division protein ZipA